MKKILTLSAIMISVILLSGTLGFVLDVPDAFAGKGGGEKVDICHNESSSEKKTINVSINAITAHLSHGDFVGTCEFGLDCNHPTNFFKEECQLNEPTWSRLAGIVLAELIRTVKTFSKIGMIFESNFITISKIYELLHSMF